MIVKTARSGWAGPPGQRGSRAPEPSYVRAGLALAAGLFGAAIFVACGDSGESDGTTSGCPEGVICGTGGASVGPGGGAGTTVGQGGNGSCTEAWECTPWETDGTNDQGTRTCTDKNGCGTTLNKPVEAATLPALDLEYYKCNVEPIRNRSCSMMGCHGTDSRGLRVYSRGRYRAVDDLQGQPIIVTQTGCPPGQTDMYPMSQCIGSIECACFNQPHTPTEWRRNYDASRGFALGSDGQPLGDMEQSELIQQAMEGGGKAHAGYKLFKSTDAEHTTVKAWLDGTTLGRTCNTTN